MTSSAGRPSAEVRATYPSMRKARDGLMALERRGVEAEDIGLEGPGAARAKLPVTNDEERQTDLAVMGYVGRRAGVGAVLVGFAGAVLGAVAGAVLHGAVTAVAGAVAVGALALALGFLWGGFTGLAADDAFGDTFVALDEGEPVVVVVHHAENYESVVEALRATQPSSLQVA